jgi:hypothetical protein
MAKKLLVVCDFELFEKIKDELVEKFSSGEGLSDTFELTFTFSYEEATKKVSNEQFDGALDLLVNTLPPGEQPQFGGYADIKSVSLDKTITYIPMSIF